ncbi:MAG: c-type cytochrome [Alphaproteobacteria bacterium]|jgi:putative heme-binding domain-containing protein|nr:c-type cytochrome [Alphaproteobacteria bacterium]MDP7641582.1 c-type cytochrome [Alphaproteobacteria bacterium]
MLKAVGFAFAFMVVVLGLFLWIGHSVTSMVGGGKKVVSAVEVTPEGGETIFWGKGRCFTCHSVGGRGSAVRGPNQGVFGEKFQEPIGIRAASRARQRSEQTGEEYSDTDYLVESLAVPGAYVVSGYKNEMAIVYAPPISLSLKEVKAVITYLQSQGGDPDTAALENPSEISARYIARIQAASAAGGGDPGAGAIVFEDNCMECHIVKGEGDEVGPDLSAISAKGLKFISESITEPSKQITEGFETYEVIDVEGRKTIGLKTRDDAEEIDITKATGEVVTIAKSDIKEINSGELASIMPNDLIEALTVKDFQDVLAYMIMQKGE